MKSILALENGLVFTGESFGYAGGETAGEVVFNTSITGYQEILTDPSYCGQIVTMTHPHIGNYGVNRDDEESGYPAAAGIIVKEYSRVTSNWRAGQSLDEYLSEHRMVGIAGIDTRMLVRALRTDGAMRGVISPLEPDGKALVRRAQSIPEMKGRDLAGIVTCREQYEWTNVEQTVYNLPLHADKSVVPIYRTNGKRKRVVVMDFGVKRNILRRLLAYGCDLIVVPADDNAANILSRQPDGVFLSNGPGDPEAVRYAIATIEKILTKVPVFGICLGHQLMSLALGGKTYKLKFGHHGSNHPVKNLLTGAIEITSQNHGFAVEWESMDENETELTHLNLNDQTVEGFRHRTLPAFAVQYHPEASPGPHDSDYLFRNFITLMDATIPI